MFAPNFAKRSQRVSWLFICLLDETLTEVPSSSDIVVGGILNPSPLTHSIKNEDGVTVLHLCTLLDSAIFVPNVAKYISKAVRAIEWTQCPYSHFQRCIILSKM